MAQTIGTPFSPRTTTPGARVPAWLRRAGDSPWAILACAATVRLVIVGALDLHHTPFRGELQRTAASLATDGIYGNPYLVPTGPTAHVAPGHTLLVAAVFRVFGTGTDGELAAYLLNIGLAATIYALLPWVAAGLDLSRSAGRLAGWFGALVPFHFLNEIRTGDAPQSALTLIAIVLTGYQLLQRDQPNRAEALRVGAAWGAALLVMPTLLAVIVGLAALALYRRPSRGMALRLLAAASIAALLLAPWAWRNYARFGEPIWSRSNLGIELRLAFNDLTWPDIDRNRTGGAFDLYHPLASAAAATQLAQEGEVAYNRRLLADAWAWVRHHPGRTIRLTLERFVYFWLPRTGRSVQMLLLGGLSVAALCGLWHLWRAAHPVWRVFALTWSLFPPVYYIAQAAVRYRYPMTWTLLLAAATLLTPRRRAPRGDRD